MHDMYTKETLIKLSAVWDLKACSGTPLCLMMHTRATYMGMTRAVSKPFVNYILVTGHH